VPSSIVHPPSSLFLAGPTAVGKSNVALLLAERLGGEIIAVDSMQVYRGLDIGTAKPTAQEQQRVPHHLVDVVEWTEPFDAAQFVRRARVAEGEIQARGRVAIFCGGTGLYFKAFLEGLGAAPPVDPGLRFELEATPLGDLLRELQNRDPIAFETIDRQNPRRVIRAIEVIRLTGKPVSTQRATWGKKGAAPPSVGFYGLERGATDLQARIDVRVDWMFAHGLVEETKGLLARGLEQNRTAAQAIGYRQVLEYLRGQRSLSETIALVKIRTRQFARRQRTWFRHQAQLQWLSLAPEESPEKTAERIESLWLSC